MTSLCLASDGLLGGGSAVTIATRGQICLIFKQPRKRFGTGGKLSYDIKKEFPEGIKDGVITKHYYDVEEDEDIVLVMMSIL